MKKCIDFTDADVMSFDLEEGVITSDTIKFVCEVHLPPDTRLQSMVMDIGAHKDVNGYVVTHPDGKTFIIVRECDNLHLHSKAN